MTAKNIFPLIQETTQAFGPHYQSQVQAVFAEFGFQGGDWFITYIAYGLDPEPLMITFLKTFIPYRSSQNLKDSLAEVASRGFLEAVSEDAYRPTDKGRTGVTKFFELAQGAISQLEPLPSNDLIRLADLLGHVVEATQNAPEPADKSHFLISRRADPGPTVPPVVKIDQYLTDLSFYRDDAHIEAWQPYGISGPAWEAFTFVWRGEAANAEMLAEKLAFRGNSGEIYAQALQDLVQRGWVEEKGGAYRATEAGQTVRQAAEELTDRYFYTPWTNLSNDDVQALSLLLTQLREGLQQLAEAKQTA